jgi:sigma-B regulation protein RsbQ
MFSRLVFLNASARYIGDDSTGYVGAFSQQQVDQLLLAIAGDFAAWSYGFAATAMGNADRPELASEFARSLADYDPAVTLTMFRAAFTSDFRHIVPRITAPTLVLQNQCDPAVPMEAARWLASTLPNGTFGSLSSTGHFPHLVAPEEVIAAIEDLGLTQ